MTPVINAIKLFSGLPMEKSKKLVSVSGKPFHTCKIFAKKAGASPSGAQVLQYAFSANIR